MKKLLLISALLGLSVTVSAQDYETGTEKWSSKLLLDTCSRELRSAINHVKKSLDKKVEYVAIMPEEIGYKYFDVVFKVSNKGIVLPENASKKFIHQFEYWSKSDEHTDCNRVEPTEFIY